MPGVERFRFPEQPLLFLNRLTRSMRAPLARPIPSVLSAALDGADLLHVLLPSLLGIKALREARARGIPVVCSFHVQPENALINLRLMNSLAARELHRLAVRYFYNMADAVIAPSPFAADLLKRHGLSSPARVISNGVPEEFFASPIGRDDGRFRILSVGRLGKEKRQDTLIRAVRHSAWRDRIELRIVGTGPERVHLARLAAKIGVEAIFEAVDDATLVERYRTADLFVQTGTVELEGIAVLEAMACGNVILVADSKDSASVGFATRPEAKFCPSDPIDLARKIDFWIEQEDERLSQGHENCSLARRYSHRLATEEMERVYSETAR